MFRGVQNGSVDDKGRLKLSAAVVRRLKQEYSRTDLYVTSTDGRQVQVYPIREWEVVEQRMAEPATGPEQGKLREQKKKLKRWTDHFGSEAKVDSQGRLMLPATLREEAGIRGAVKVQWQFNHMLVLDEAAYQVELEKNALSASDLELAASLGM